MGFRGAVRLSRPSLRMVSSQAERRNGSIPWPPCGNRLDARMASGISRDAKLYVYSRRSTVPQFFIPPGDAAIAVCSSACAWRPDFHAISGHLVSLTRRSSSKSISPISCKTFSKQEELTKITENADRNRPEMTTPSCFAPDVFSCRDHTLETLSPL